MPISAANQRVRLTLRRSVVIRAKLAAETLGVANHLDLMAVALGLGLRALELQLQEPGAPTSAPTRGEV